MAGGYFEDIGFSNYPVRVAEMSEDDLVEELVADAAAQRWGAFGEIASSLVMRPDERKVHRAVARAHLRTGLPIFTHTPHESCPTCAIEQLDVIEGAGVDLSHVVIGHMATIRPEHDPLGTHTAVARRGAFVGLDTLGHEMGRSDIPAADKVRMVQDLLDAGLEDHILLSSDQGNVRQFNRYYGHGWASVLMQFVPKLRFAGVPEDTIRKILVDNPRRFLAFVPAGLAARGKSPAAFDWRCGRKFPNLLPVPSGGVVPRSQIPQFAPSTPNVAPSGVAEPVLRLLGARQSPRPFLRHALLSNRGPFPPPALPGFPGTTGATLRGPT